MQQQYHIGIIPDGNRRWARERNLSDKEGHKHGSIVVKDAIEWALKKPEIKEVSIYILSEENFNRSKEELKWLNAVYSEGLNDLRHREFIRKLKVRVKMISTKPEKLDSEVKKVFKSLHSETKIYSNKVLNILIGYTGKSEILAAINKPLNKIKNLFFGLTEKDILKGMQIQSSCDFIIRSSFEEAERESKSGFLIWQSAYSEYYNIPKHWGDVTTDDLEKAWNYFLETKRNHGN
ncbi:hypothetical protein LCGC14_0700210 [marine sediment metagenome]|uniref:Undecaprenyl diphosphate synthase n=1 Tax=marine sediment metagenome TaxID=412755 RepID=A0A0F9QMP4_9ZZZZ